MRAWQLVTRTGARSTTRPANAQTAPAVNAPRSPENATTVPQMSAPSPCDASKNDENVPTTDAALGITHAVEREQQQRGIHQRHAAREHDRADDQPGDGRPRRDHADADGHDHERDRRGRAPAELVGNARAEDAHGEDEHAVEREDQARARC